MTQNWPVVSRTRDVEGADRALNVRRYTVPIEMWIEIGEIGRRSGRREAGRVIASKSVPMRRHCAPRGIMPEAFAMVRSREPACFPFGRAPYMNTRVAKEPEHQQGIDAWP